MSATIVKAAIHPGIGIARLGDSPDGFFIGPEVRFPCRVPPNWYKDASGALKRQAARFRVYGLDDDGKVVAELNSTNARVTWTAHVANKKAAWYNFELAMDIPESVACTRRNAGFVGDEREKLVIDPGPRSIAGQPGEAPVPFDTGTFIGKPVYLGELRTDEHGNLLFLGGRGQAHTPFPHNAPYAFGNNDGWHDDISDGPVTAEVVIDGRPIPVDPAWIVVAPPNFAPDIVSVQTMYDVLFDAYQETWYEPTAVPSFTDHIYPVLRQFCDAQWVNYGFHVQFGWKGPEDFLQPDYIRKLSIITRDKSGATTDIYQPLRRQVLHLFRDSSAATTDPSKWPQMYGDAIGVPNSPRNNLALTATQYQFLSDWAIGNFLEDWKGLDAYPGGLDSVPLAERPANLDRAALWFCLGGPFHPGCEMTWPMRNVTIYRSPFRIRPRADGEPEPDYGETLTPVVAVSEHGPLFAHGPGDLTRWMAVPWHADSASCRAGYDKQYDPYLPTFWPARVPNHVLSEEHFQIVMNRKLPREVRQEAFDTRSTWNRWFTGVGADHWREMIHDFSKLGVLERRDGPGDAEFPPELYVESQVGFHHAPHFRQNLTNGPKDKLRKRRHPSNPSE